MSFKVPPMDSSAMRAAARFLMRACRGFSDMFLRHCAKHN